MATITLRLGDSFEIIPELTDISAIVCDPPYLINFMNKKWDEHEGENVDWFAEWLQKCYDILPSGGVVKVFSATRTFHRLVQAMEQVGYQDLKLEAWVYGSGFPKSLNLSKAIDKMQGTSDERAVVGSGIAGSGFHYGKPGFGVVAEVGGTASTSWEVTAPASDDAQRFEGWGTALKPAWEPFVVGVKP